MILRRWVGMAFLLWLVPAMTGAAGAPVSEATEACLACHSTVHPGIVEDWRRGRHARVTPAQALQATGLARKLSSTSVPEKLKPFSVGCAECHTLNAEAHADTFDHHDQDVHVVVTPEDCAVCHAEETRQYGENVMSHARRNLAENTLYQDLERNIIGPPERRDGRIVHRNPEPDTRAESCFYCHGTRLDVRSFETRETRLGEMVFPVIDGWPNQGVGRQNPDGSQGSCTPCHARHSFSMEMARKPDTCRECHVGPDVPAHKIYLASKHGNLYFSLGNQWRFDATPWVVGRDITAPTCATCHISLLTDTDGDTVATRTHAMSDRLPWRIFGLIYAHAHPRQPDTSRIRNKSGLPLPTDLDGTPAVEYLIDAPEQEKRTTAMRAVCRSCHAHSWVDAHWRRFERTIRETNAEVRVATAIMNDIWNQGFAKGPDQDESAFDEGVERQWASIWLFYANTVRFASAMGGGGDYTVFTDGRYQLSERTIQLEEWLRSRLKSQPRPGPVATGPVTPSPVPPAGPWPGRVPPAGSW